MRTLVVTTLLMLTLSACQPPSSQTDDPGPDARQLQQLITYTFTDSAQRARTDAYLAEALLPALHRLDLEPVGVFHSRITEADSIPRSYVLIGYDDWIQFEAARAALASDSLHLTAGAPYLEAPHDQPPFERMETTLLRAFADMPRLAAPDLPGPRAARVYELRSYESPTEALFINKVEMFNAGGEVALFDRLDFNAVFYGKVIAGSAMPNLMYMTSFADMASRDAHWEAFVNSPTWDSLSNDPYYANNVSHADIWLLYPTSYSDY